MSTLVSSLPAIPQDGPASAARMSTANLPASQIPVLHIPSLDGLRALSFLIVFIAHVGMPMPLAIPGGFGVTVFFFLSGFLITTLLRLEHEATGGVSIRNFYIRRALRILPPFYLVLAATAALTIVGLLPGRLQAAPIAAQSLHFVNYWFIFHGSEGTPAGTVPYWSLAVEEHFYLVFPLLYLLLNRWLSRTTQAATLWVMCAAVLIWRCALVFGFDVGEDRTYMASDARFDSILFGCALALGMNPVLDRPVAHERLWKWAFLPVALALLVASFSYRAPWFRETLRYTVQGLALTPVFVAAIRYPDWWPFRILNTRAVAFLGTLSYTLYLTHQSIIIALYYWAPDMNRFVRAGAAFALSFAVAYVIYVVVEKPCARLRRKLMRRPQVSAVAAIS